MKDGQTIPNERGLLYPLDVFYRASGRIAPAVAPLTGKAMPQHYRALLVHENDMTPTLEQHHGRLIHLRTLSSRRDGELFQREVLLLTDGENQPVEYGVIEINLGLFSEQAREEILLCQKPLGTILRDCAVKHFSRPRAFFRVQSEEIKAAGLQFQSPCALYGRRNTLTTLNNQPLAEIVEILIP